MAADTVVLLAELVTLAQTSCTELVIIDLSSFRDHRLCNRNFVRLGWWVRVRIDEWLGFSVKFRYISACSDLDIGKHRESCFRVALARANTVLQPVELMRAPIADGKDHRLHS